MSRSTWLTHFWLPTAVFAGIALLFALSDLDHAIASAWAFDASSGEFFARRATWANAWVHTGGRNFIWLVAVICALLGAAGWLGGARFAARWPQIAAARSRLLWVVVSIGVTTSLIGAIKHLSNVDCPWDLTLFGGDRPYVKVFALRPQGLPRGVCFPGAHAGSGFALFALYFAFRDTQRRLAAWCLAAAAVIGALFAFGQEARGAHFLSHDLWSAWLAWTVCLALYALRCRLTSRRRVPASPAAAAAGTVR